MVGRFSEVDLKPVDHKCWQWRQNVEEILGGCWGGCCWWKFCSGCWEGCSWKMEASEEVAADETLALMRLGLKNGGFWGGCCWWDSGIDEVAVEKWRLLRRLLLMMLNKLLNSWGRFYKDRCWNCWWGMCWWWYWWQNWLAWLGRLEIVDEECADADISDEVIE